MVERLTRAQWGALPPKRPQTPMPTAAGVTIHYEGPRMGAYKHSTCIGKVRGIQRFHMGGTRDSWKDTAYNEIVCRHGVRFECRGYGAESGANGTGSANRTSYAICALIGEGDDVTPELVAGIADAAADYRRHGAGPKVWGHRDHFATACPGGPLYALVKSGAFSSNTAPSQTPAPEEDDMPYSEAQMQQFARDAFAWGMERYRHPKDTVGRSMYGLLLQAATGNADVDYDKVAEAVAAKMPAGADRATMKGAFVDALKELAAQEQTEAGQ